MLQISPDFPTTVRAIVFDMDGTLYNQRSLRAAMARSLAIGFCSNPSAQMKALNFLRAYRQAQEHLRHGTPLEADIAEQQLNLACRSSDTPRVKALDYLQRWFSQEPTKHLIRLADATVTRFIQQAKASGLALGVYSDYPPKEKIQALGLGGLFDVIACSSDLEIGKLKPDPAGLHYTLQRLHVDSDATIYVGDRMDVDAPCARAAGVHAVILNKSPQPRSGVTMIPDFTDLELIFQQRNIFAQQPENSLSL